MNDMSLLRDYLKSKILKLEGTKVQEVKQKSEILVQHFLSISKSELYLKDIPLSKKDIKTNRISTFAISKFYELLMFPLLFNENKSIRQNQENI